MMMAMMASSSSHNNHHSHATPAGGGDAATVLRPTEAQLRWAQFHHKRRAVGVRASVEALHQSPATWEQVPGSVPEDGNSSSSSSSSSGGGSQHSSNTTSSSTRRTRALLKEIRKRRPAISRGRRALLRVSRRSYERRREIILKQGYQGMTMMLSSSGSTSDSSSSSSEGSSKNNENDRHHDHQNHEGGGDEESDVHEDALNEIFLVQSSRWKQQQRRRRNNDQKLRRLRRRRNPQKDESFKRFQAACHAMMMNLAAPPKHSIVIPTRKWTRTVDPAAALDDEYLDPKWGIRRRQDHGGDHASNPAFGSNDNNHHHLAPMDRGASWMMHLPKGQSSARENPYYHDPSLALPPSAGSYQWYAGGSDSQESSVASTLALQAPGAHKFNMLVALVQQRMIQRHQDQDQDQHQHQHHHEGLNRRQDEDGKELLELQQDPGMSEFHTRPSMEGLQRSPYLPHHSSSNEMATTTTTVVRRSHYVPRMRLRDFVPEGTSAEDVEELERSLMDGKGIPPKMKLRGFLGAATDGDPQSSTSRRKSRTQELAESYEASKHQGNKDRRLSKTRQMAQSLEGININNSKHPKMRLRPNYEFRNGEDEEKKLSDDSIAATEDGPPRRHSHALSGKFDQSGEGDSSGDGLNRPTRHPHALSGPFSGPDVTQEESHLQTRVSMSAESIGENAVASQDEAARMSHHEDKSGLLQDPPRRKPHPMSDRFVEAMQASQQSPQRAHIMVKPLPPGTCCSRCAKPSPAASTSTNTFPFTGRESTGAEGDFFAQVRSINAKVSVGSARVSDFFSHLRQTNDASTTEHPATENIAKQSSISTDVTRSATGSHRVSDFFAKVRQSNPKTEQHQPQSTSQTDDVPLEETDFFAQVREMIATSDDDEESAAQRVSDFFAQVREMSNEMEEDENVNAQDDSSPLCEECQVEDIEERVESASVSLSPEHGAEIRISESASPARASNANLATAKTDSFDDDSKSEHSAISELWNRGRTSFNSFASSLNAISEKTAKVSVNPINQGRISATRMPGRVGGFLQKLQGQKEQEQEILRAQLAEEEGGEQHMHVSAAKDGGEKSNDSSNIPTQNELDYSGENDLEAMAAYRRSQEMKRLSSPQDGDTSSHSSFHVLPVDIREVVKRQGSSPPKNTRQVSTSPQRAVGHPSTSNTKEILPQHKQRPPLSSPGRDTSVEGNLNADLAASALSRPSTGSPSRVSVTSSAFENLSPEKYREAHERVLHGSPLLGNVEQGIIDTDGTTSDASNYGMNPQLLASMMLSPDLLQKRLHQAVRAVEERHWGQVEYLLNANPWLAEMCELTTNQYLLHKVAFFGFSAPRKLCESLMEMFPSAIYKFDHDGNVPLHLAAAAGHMKMIRMLGEKFGSGASIRNEDGMLPLHFTIASYAEYKGQYDQDEEDEDDPSPLRVIKTVLKFFPEAVAIGDNDGNLPIHVAAECLSGGFGVDVIYLLLDEADRQLQDPDGARFHNKVKLKDIVSDDISASTMPSDGEIESLLDEDIHCIMVKNDFGETPVLAAVRHRRGWDVTEALVSGPGGQKAALYEDAGKNNVLHLLVGEYQDPAAAMSILKIVPKTATMRNSDGMLPIEVACLQLMPEEVILAMALVDLPFDIDDKDIIKLRDDHGGSWWFLVCECDDHYVDIVQQILMICTFQQVRELCFAKRGSKQQQDTVISRATPKCKVVLSHALRYLGRFEFLGDAPLEVDTTSGLRVFDAMDFADAEGNEEGRRVILKCYSMIDAFAKATTIIRDIPLDPSHVEEIVIVGESEEKPDGQPQYCVAIECPRVTLNRVVDGMSNNAGYQHDTALRKKYAAKMCAVLRLIAKAIKHLHTSGVIHGNVCMENCGKFEQTWKLLDVMEAQRTGEPIRPARHHRSFPPEVLGLDDHEGAVYDSDITPVSFQMAPATPSIDIWAFGKLAYETLVGKPLVEFDSSKEPRDDMVSLLEILEWDQSNMKAVFSDLLESGVTDSCAELITSCLFPRPEDRPVSMDAILQDPFWKDMRQYRERSSPSKRSKGDAESTQEVGEI